MKYFKLIGIFTLLVFSFYLTDYATNIAMNNNPIMKEINNNKDILFVSSVNATIKENTIIPGKSGKEVNEVESFLKMKDFKSFNINYIIYNYIKPDISVEDNKDKIIISGNKSIRNISLLILSTNHEKLLKNINYTRLIRINDLLNYKENINIESNKNNYKDLNTLLNKKELNKKICIIDYSNIDECKKNNYYLVNPSIIINNTNFINEINNINNGSIILTDKNLKESNLNILLKKIKTHDLKVVYLSELIKE